MKSQSEAWFPVYVLRDAGPFKTDSYFSLRKEVHRTGLLTGDSVNVAPLHGLCPAHVLHIPILSAFLP